MCLGQAGFESRFIIKPVNGTQEFLIFIIITMYRLLTQGWVRGKPQKINNFAVLFFKIICYDKTKKQKRRVYMKVQVIYSSLSGRTQKVAEGIFNGICAEEKTIHNLKDGAPVLDGDIIILGYWVDAGKPNEEMSKFMPEIKDKAVGLFCTLGFYADSAHAHNSIERGVDMVKDNNTIIGTYICNGSLSDQIKESSRKREFNQANEYRWEVMKNHPTESEINLAVERFNERINLYKLFKDGNLEFKSIL